MVYFPISISQDEIFVRYLTNRDLKKGKIRYNDVFLDTRYPCVSLQRLRFCDEDCCRFHSKSLDIIGFLFFNVNIFNSCINEYNNETTNILAEIVYSPMNDDGYLAKRNNCSHSTAGNPHHSDILYSNPTNVFYEIPRTVIREFSKKLFRNSLLMSENGMDYELTNHTESFGTAISSLTNL
jgi:hypothetical protein